MHVYDERHPVTDEMRIRINTELFKIEQEYNVKILYACESGSRGWGFASSDSDYDVRFIYVEQPEFFISLDSGRDVIEKPIDSLLDISGWSLKKTLGLLWKSNPAVYEWLDSPIVYRRNPMFIESFTELAKDYFKPAAAWGHYSALTFNTHKRFLTTDEVRLKKYFYALRPILAAQWVLDKGTVPPMVFERLLEQVQDPVLMKSIEQLMELKRSSTEVKYITADPVLNTFIERFLALEVPKFSSPKASYEKLNEYLLKTVKYYAKSMR